MPRIPRRSHLRAACHARWLLHSRARSKGSLCSARYGDEDLRTKGDADEGLCHRLPKLGYVIIFLYAAAAAVLTLSTTSVARTSLAAGNRTDIDLQAIPLAVQTGQLHHRKSSCVVVVWQTSDRCKQRSMRYNNSTFSKFSNNAAQHKKQTVSQPYKLVLRNTQQMTYDMTQNRISSRNIKVTPSIGVMINGIHL